MVGFVTSVIIRVGSVTSTCLRSSFGDMRNRSGPMLPLSSGTLPGQISTTRGSAGAADHAIINVTREAANLIGARVLLFDARRQRVPHRLTRSSGRVCVG